MTEAILLKVLFLSVMWTILWLGRFIYTGADINIKNICIALAPWIPPVFYFFFFWWG